MKNTKIKNDEKIKLPFIKDAQFKRSTIRRLMIVCFFIFLVVFNLFVSTKDSLSINVGDICPDNIIAPTRIVDTDMTEALRAQAADMTSPVYDYISATSSGVAMNLSSLSNVITGVYDEYTPQDSAEYYNGICRLNLTEEDYDYLITADGSVKNKFISALGRIITSVYEKGVKSTEIDKTVAEAETMLSSFGLTERSDAIARSVLKSLITPNMILNESATKIAREAASDSVYEVVYEAGQTIINKGEVVTAHQIKLLKNNGIIRVGLFDSARNSIGMPGMLLIFTLMLLFYLKQYHPEIFYRNTKLCMLMLLFMIISLVAQWLYPFSVFLVPAALFTLCASLLFGANTAVQLNIFVSLFLSIGLRLDIDSFFYLIVSGYAGVVYSNKINKRSDLFKSIITICIVNMIAVLLIMLLRNSISALSAKDLVFALGGAMISAVGSSALLMIFEDIFNVTTPFTLLEMSGSSDTLINNLLTKAPGTYYHSVLVGNLSEAACAAIGANALLARVGAYYHDIGKADKALYYKENQGAESNPHDLITPETSARIIKNHVSDGIFMAEKRKLPDEIIDFIRTHHGTSELTYFKVKAQEEGYEGDEDFCYSGELPISKETTVVMLADSIEATCRTLDDHEYETIMAMIDKITKKKIHEGQMLDSTLSFEELEKVKASFAESLTNIYHSRIKYPEEEQRKNESSESGDEGNV